MERKNPEKRTRSEITESVEERATRERDDRESERKEVSRERGRFLHQIGSVASATTVLRVARPTGGMSPPVARGFDSMKTYVSACTRGCERARAHANISRPIRHRAPTFIVRHGDFSLWVEVARVIDSFDPGLRPDLP